MFHDVSAAIGTRSTGRAGGWRDHGRSTMRPRRSFLQAAVYFTGSTSLPIFSSHFSFLCFSVDGPLFVPLWFGSKICYSCQAKARFLRGNPCFSSSKGLSLVVVWH
ncbi:hypothetical protein SESBI_07579 [Sesbania bispinosa]|nr:hypothetical protein SESBI_07579 [Sesbania bispinosa]